MVCDTSRISFIRRHSAPGYVYIAASKAGRLLKVGSTADWSQREKYLSQHKYGGFTDWQIIARAKTHAMGEMEFDLHKALAKLAVEGSYEKEGRVQATRELFRGDLVKVWQAYNMRTEKVEAGQKWRHPGFNEFSFGQ